MPHFLQGLFNIGKTLLNEKNKNRVNIYHNTQPLGTKRFSVTTDSKVSIHFRYMFMVEILMNCINMFQKTSYQKNTVGMVAQFKKLLVSCGNRTAVLVVTCCRF